ncbi:MAG TPA: MATE family efflux transporter [Candidatus Acetatifactor stercoripullorum]|uniref:MATE family efflux transporter n=1 Tax=Candidatus Acetatifactor stercoripullorum TaxID=2838414 RepID=A0A9D1R789_9FIRM|nr:MATE family efflux transporter [Candidatus Acetatifactor stercoripullorum]HIW82337.1 MATE family efflux transporter [Candidatus Acetatifactor stercoripullorum]
MTKEKNAKKYEIDMCSGPLFGKILLFYIPLMLSGILQLLFNAADIVVVGRFVGSEALAAVGSTSSLINLLVNVFIGLSVGANVLAARFFGAGKKEELSDMVHTAIATSLVSGIFLIFLGVLLARPALLLMETPENVIDQAVLYMRIYFIGMPATMAYNFGSAILRAAGDTKRPLYYLFAAGVVNVVLNLFFVIVCGLGVAGVAIATVISQVISAALVIRCLALSDSDYKLDLKRLRIVPDKLLRMVQIGVPAGLQGALFSVSNVLIQSSVNSFGSVAMAGNTAASNIEGFVYTSMNAFHQTAISFTGQNYGARNYKRIGRILLICQLLVIAVGLLFGNAAYLLGDKLLLLYSSEPEVITYGLLRMSIICTTYCLCGMMDVMVGSLRGMGYSVMPMLVSLTGACLFRILWIYTVFREIPTLQCLYWSYPVSWGLTFLAHLLCFVVVYRKLLKTES